VKVLVVIALAALAGAASAKSMEQLNEDRRRIQAARSKAGC